MALIRRGVRRAMRGFYEFVARTHVETFDVDEAARLEIEWWRVHRQLQREDTAAPDDALVEALAALYAHVYDVEPPRQAAVERALAMRYSDQWVDEGCRLDSPLIGLERAALIRSYAALLAAVHR